MQRGSLAGLSKSVLQWMATPRRLVHYRQTVTHLLLGDQSTLFMGVGFQVVLHVCKPPPAAQLSFPRSLLGFCERPRKNCSWTLGWQNTRTQRWLQPGMALVRVWCQVLIDMDAELRGSSLRQAGYEC